MKLSLANNSIVRVTSLVALFTALVIAISPPAGYLTLAYQEQNAMVSVEIDTKSKLIQHLIVGNPEFWQYEEGRLDNILLHNGDTAKIIVRRFIDTDGNLLGSNRPEPHTFFWPTIKHQREIYESGTLIGRLEIIKSLKHLWQSAIIIGLISTLSSLILFILLQQFPLRALNRSWNRIQYLATHDSMTGLTNRAQFLLNTEHALANISTLNSNVTIYSLDLDRFKDVNDIFGHAAGDLLLKLAIERIQGCIRQGDTLARLGGDEFAITQIGVNHIQDAAVLAERIISQISKPFNIHGHKVNISVSIGICQATSQDTIKHRQDLEAWTTQLMKHTDLALYEAKNSGRSTYHIFEEQMNTADRQLKALEVDLRKAINEEQFSLHYQPQLDLATQRIMGLEALLRWHHPERGNIPPMQFVPIIESMGLMPVLTEWILQKACEHAVILGTVRMAINIPPSLLQRDEIVSMVKSALRRTGLPANRLELEITEDALITRTRQTLKILEELRKVGVLISLDDFGTGYSSLNYLRRFRFDKLKIDRSFIHEIGKKEDARAIVHAIIVMSKALGMTVIAEGVETLEEAETLVKEGCDEVQGFLFCQPLSETAIQELLVRTKSLEILPTADTNRAMAG